MVLWRRLRVRFALTVLATSAVTAALGAAELQGRTARAWTAYIEQARQAFVDRARAVRTPPVDAAMMSRLRGKAIIAGPAEGDGILDVPGGLIHHWIGRAFISGATLEQAVDVSRAYGDYASIYKPVMGASVLQRNGDSYVVLVRLRGGDAGISAVIDVRSRVEYVRVDERREYSTSLSEEVHQVEHAGESSERHLPEGRDSGYIWRAATFTNLIEQDEGVYVEMETVALSRRFPPLLGWFIEPIARRLGRRSVEASLEEFRTAVQDLSRQTRAH